MASTSAFGLQRHLERRGLPLFVLPRRRWAELPKSAAAGTLVLLLASTVMLLCAQALASADPNDTTSWPTGLVLLAVAVLTLPLWSWGLVLLVRRLPAHILPVVAAGSAALHLVLGWLAPLGMSWVARLGWLLLVVTASYLGLGRILVWAARRSLQEFSSLGPMVSRVLPLLIFTMLSLFFNAEVWQVVVHLSMPRTWALFAVLLGAGVLLAWVTTRDFVQDAVADHRAEHPGVAPLRFAERFNVVLDLMLITLVQVALLGCVVFSFFMAFGALSVPDATAQAWMGEEPQPLRGIWAVLHVSQNLVQVCLIMAAVASLSFVASATTDATYREAFVSPAMAEMRQALDLRREYRAACERH